MNSQTWLNLISLNLKVIGSTLLLEARDLAEHIKNLGQAWILAWRANWATLALHSLPDSVLLPSLRHNLSPSRETSCPPLLSHIASLGRVCQSASVWHKNTHEHYETNILLPSTVSIVVMKSTNWWRKTDTIASTIFPGSFYFGLHRLVSRDAARSRLPNFWYC